MKARLLTTSHWLLPGLVAAYPVAFFAAGNASEVSLTDVAIALAFFWAAGAVVQLCVALAGRRHLASSTIAVIAAIINAVVFPATLMIERHPIVRFGSGELPFRASMAVVIGLAVLAIWRLWRAGGHRPGVFRAAGLATAAIYAALVVTGLGVARERSRLERMVRGTSLARPIATARTGTAPQPDVYVFLLDTYASAGVLSSAYDFRDDAFRDSLARLGFELPTVRANYSVTSHALASMANADYLDEFEPIFDGVTSAIWPLYHLAHDDRVSAFLESKGYHAYVVPSIGWGGTRTHDRATVHLATTDMGELRGAIERTPLIELAWERTLPGKFFPGWRPIPGQHRAALAAFTGTLDLLGAPSPKYVLAHSMLAHFPFQVTADCGPRRSFEALSEEFVGGREAYLDGIRCTNHLVLATITEILARSTTPPIIILQSDHGPRRLGTPWVGDAARITPEQAIERFEVFGAYHFPGVDRLLPDTTSPVNVMRAMLSHYFGASLPPLPNRSMHATVDRRYDFHIVPDSVFARTLSPVAPAPRPDAMSAPADP